ncbi:MAG TPA: hypothetical protein VMJ34_14490 [Bryobacteraceae bacterium]|nr:hypothetical protein [Bryobacteraceae bacterium]
MKPGIAILLCAALGGLAFAQGQTTRPLKTDSTPARPREPSLTYNQLITIGYDLLKTARIGEAYLAATRAALKDPDRFEAYALAALALHLKDADQEAKSFVDKALERVPEQKRAQVLKIADLIKSGAASKPPDTPALSADARRKMDALQVIIQEADKASGAGDRRKLLAEFLEKSEPFVREHPSQVDIWSVRAAVAIELDDAAVGWQTGRKLLELGQGESLDPKMRKLMAMLERRGWLAESIDGHLFEQLKERLALISPQQFQRGRTSREDTLLLTGTLRCDGVDMTSSFSNRYGGGGTEGRQLTLTLLPADAKFGVKIERVDPLYVLWTGPLVVHTVVNNSSETESQEKREERSIGTLQIFASEHAEILQQLGDILMQIHKACFVGQ